MPGSVLALYTLPRGLTRCAGLAVGMCDAPAQLSQLNTIPSHRIPLSVLTKRDDTKRDEMHQLSSARRLRSD